MPKVDFSKVPDVADREWIDELFVELAKSLFAKLRIRVAGKDGGEVLLAWRVLSALDRQRFFALRSLRLPTDPPLLKPKRDATVFGLMYQWLDRCGRILRS